MDKLELKERLLQVLSEIQSDAGQDCPDLTDKIVPLKDLPGFDSLAGVEAEDRLSQLVGRNIDRIDFVRDGRELTIKEIVDDLTNVVLGAAK